MTEREREDREKGERVPLMYSKTDHTRLDRRTDAKQHTDHKYGLQKYIFGLQGSQTGRQVYLEYKTDNKDMHVFQVTAKDNILTIRTRCPTIFVDIIKLLLLLVLFRVSEIKTDKGL